MSSRLPQGLGDPAYWPEAFNRASQALQNCGQVWPGWVLPAALSVRHSCPHSRMRDLCATCPDVPVVDPVAAGGAVLDRAGGAVAVDVGGLAGIVGWAAAAGDGAPRRQLDMKVRRAGPCMF
jgi:hypothetical protein